MAKAETVGVIPQRYNGHGWVQCEPHRAQQWAVARKRAGKVLSVIARYSTKRMAEQVAETERTRAQGPYRPYPKPGSRLLRRPSTERYGFGADASLDADSDFIRSL